MSESGFTTTTHDLPSGWIWTTLGEISDKPQYGWTTKANSEAGSVKLLRTTDITSGNLDWSRVPYCSENPDDLAKYLVQPGDIVISRAGSVGFSYLLSHVERAVFASYLIRFRIKPSINKRYVSYYLQSPAYWRTIGASQAGIAVPNVNAEKLERVQIPLAPEPQQKRIVAEIEKQFSRLDEAVVSLKCVKANLKRYKAAVLKAAVEGKLTEDWRKQHPDVEPASKLLEHILADRRTKWNGRGKYKEPVEPNADKRGPVPNSWAWVSLEQLCPRFVDSAHRTPQYGQTGVPALGPRDVVGGKLNLKNARCVDKTEFAIQTERHVPEGGDIVYSRELSLGWGAIIPPGVRVCLSQGMCLFRPHEAVDSRYFLIVLIGPHGRRQAEMAATGSAHPHINLGEIKSYSIPLPPSPEQQQIVAEVESRLSVIDELEATVEANVTRADRLRQAILGQAFSGRLLGESVKRIPDSAPTFSLAAESRARYGSEDLAES